MMTEATTVTWDEINYRLQQNNGLLKTIREMNGTLVLGKILVQDEQSLGIPGLSGLVIQYKTLEDGQFNDPPRIIVVPLPKEKLIDLARTVLRELDPKTDDLILKELRRLNDRLDKDDQERS